MIATAIFPGRYVQGKGALALMPEEIGRLGSKAFTIVSKTVLSKVAPLLKTDKGIEVAIEPFGGECCDEEIDRLVEEARRARATVIVGVGGGKALDTTKAVGHAMGLPTVVAPSLASTDAPCSALSVIYTPEGGFKRYLFLTHNPNVVLVDTALIVEAPVRLLVAGMGDALSTWFEAEDCKTTGANNMTGRPGTLTAYALARLCYDTLLQDGAAAKRDGERKTITPAFEHIVEANTLLSGLGFESGGLSGAHAIHDGLTVLPGTHAFWHGEKVAFGTLALLMLSKRPAAVVDEVYGFCETIGLPTTFAAIGMADATDEDLRNAAEAACSPADTMANVPGDAAPSDVVAAMKAADAEGRRRQKK